MKNNISWANKLLITVLALIITCWPIGLAAAATDAGTAHLDQAQGYYQQQESLNEWEALAVRWAGLASGPKLDASVPASPSDYARAIMGAIAADQDPAHLQGWVDSLQSMQTEGGWFAESGETEPTLNQTVWPLIALNFAGVNGRGAADFDPVKAVEYILSKQDVSGGFDESGYGVDVDSTAHSLIALAPYQHQEECRTSIEEALNYLKSNQFDNGGFGSWGSDNPDSTAAVIEALMALGIDPESAEWIPGGQSMVEALLHFQSEQGWFVYSYESTPWNDPNSPNPTSTRNALLALGDLAAGTSKYQSVLPSTNGLCLTVQTPQPLDAERDGEVAIQLDYCGDTPQTVLLIMGLYHHDAQRMQVYQAFSADLLPGDRLALSQFFPIPAGPYDARVLTWDQWEASTALLPPVVCQISE